MQNENFIGRVYKYSKERFHLGQFVPLSLILGGVLAIGTQAYFQHKLLMVPILLSATALFLFFLRLRIFDEFKDYEHDLKHYAHRPVPRGLVSKKELGFILVPLIILEFVIALVSSVDGVIFFIISFVYSLLMFKEFFVRDWIKNHFTVYIASHEVLLFPLFFYLCAINGFKITSLSNPFFWLLVLYVGSFMFLLEVARKVRSKDLEIASKDTYTAQYGIRGASLLLLVISTVAIISLIILMWIISLDSLFLVIISLSFMVIFVYRLYKFNRKPIPETAKKVFLSSIYFVFISCIGTMFILLK
ncbi:MAG: UbiA family prenyltransferase [Candidatus Paceibacterota bacterium]|jgi:4-hydroxybenzoate polyprenyltransferase